MRMCTRVSAANGFPLSGWVIKRVFTIDLNSVDNLQGYNHCVFQYHSTADETVYLSQGRRLFDSLVDVPSTPAGCKTFFTVEGLSHTALMSEAEQAATSQYISFVRTLP
jgi:hypothetical protein